MQRALTCSFLVATTMALFPSSAAAERDVQSSVLGPVRDGLTMGASFGRGSIEVECDDCDASKLTEALSLSAHVGYMITPQIGIVGEHWTVRYNQRGGALFDDSERHLVAQHMSMVAAQLFVTRSVWVKAGLGLGWHITDGDYDKDLPQNGPVVASAVGGGKGPAPRDKASVGNASFAAIGWELAANSTFAAEIQLRVGSTRDADDRYSILNTGLNIGCSWY